MRCSKRAMEPWPTNYSRKACPKGRDGRGDRPADPASFKLSGGGAARIGCPRGSGPTTTPQDAPDRGQAAVEAAPPPQLVQGVVIVLQGQPPQPPLLGEVQHGARAAAVRLG